MKTTTHTQEIETIIIGGGQAGLSVGYGLAKAGKEFLILDANHNVGDAWRNRWDSLKLFTPAYLNGLEGLPFPGPQHKFVSKDEMADYLESYAEKFKLPVQTRTRVDRVHENGQGFIINAGDKSFKAKNVVVAMTNYQKPKVPTFAKNIASDIVQMHSKDYRNPSQLKEGSVLIVGAGNSGADIALELVKGRRTFVSGNDVGHIPFRIESTIARYLLIRLVRFIGHYLLTIRTPMGRKIRPHVLTNSGPLVRVKPNDLKKAGVERVPKVIGTQDGLPVVEGGQVLHVQNIIWSTGFTPGFSWIDLPVFGENQEPDHVRGVVKKKPGLFFVGLNFLYAMTSDTITGTRRDANYIVKQILKS
jgi:putative flavoprotein involved in K+ transport